MHWPGVPWLRDQEDVHHAAEEIKETMGRNTPGNDELCRAIRWMAGPKGRQEKAPSLRELIRAVYIGRQEDRREDGEPSDPCAICGDTGWAELRPHERHPLYASAIPCTCARGDRAISKAADYNGKWTDRLQTMREQARDQWRARQREGVHK
jgi:hypothetical protein